MKIISSQSTQASETSVSNGRREVDEPGAARHGVPWFQDGNIVIRSGDREMMFKCYMGILIQQSTWFQRCIEELSDDSAEIIEGCTSISLKKGHSSQDMSNFLNAMHSGGSELSVESLQDFNYLAGVLRLATDYGSDTVRAKTLKVLQQKYPSTLEGFDRIIGEDWTHDPILAINLARETFAFSVLPAAMAYLTNNTSCGEVFGVPLHENTPRRAPMHRLNPIDENNFGLVKELNHVSVVKILKFLPEVARGCQQPPEINSVLRAPVGYYPRLGEKRSVCGETLEKMAADLSKKLILENPIGYLDFVIAVQRVALPKTGICTRCRRHLEIGLHERRVQWWNKLPEALGFSGWGDDRLHT